MLNKFMSILMSILLLTGCSLEAARGIFGYIPPPEKTTVSEELRLEYERCMKIGESDNCAQDAYNIVRRVKGLEPRKIPKGIVIILEGDGNVETQPEPKNNQDQKNNQDSQNKQ